MTIQLRHLRLVQAVLREGTLTAAARSLHLTQSALSHQLAQLEERLGAPVFERTGRGMTPTPLGTRLLEGAEAILGELRVLEQDLGEIAAGRKGLLRVAAECFTTWHWLPEVLPEFRRAYPGVEVRLVPEASHDPGAALLAGEADLALVYTTPTEPRLHARPLFIDEQVLLVPPGHPLATREHVEAADLADEHVLVYLDRPGESLFFRSVLEPAGVRPARVTEVRLSEGLLALVAAGAGVTPMTRWTAAPAIAEGRVVALRITRFGLQREWHVLLRRSDDPPPYLEAFVERLAGGPARLFDGRERERAAAGLGG